MTTNLPQPIQDYIDAGNQYDGDALIAAFADDALVNDNRREFWGLEAIRRWADREIIGDKVTMDVTDVVDHHGVFVVTADVDGDFDRSALPDRVILTFYFTVVDDRISTMFVIRNQPADH
jgi:hypothetical protein